MTFASLSIAEAATASHCGPAGGNRCAFRVGGTSFDLFDNGNEVPLTLDPGLRDFAVAPGISDVRIQVSWTNDLQIPLGAPRFTSGGLWCVFEESDGYRFYFSTP